MKNLANIITNLTIKDLVMLALSFFLLIIIGLATCHKHDHHEHDHAYKDNKHVDKGMGEFWGKTKSKDDNKQAFGEPMDELVNALTTTQELEDNLSEQDLAQIEKASKTVSSWNTRPDEQIDDDSIEVDTEINALVSSIQEEPAVKTDNAITEKSKDMDDSSVELNDEFSELVESVQGESPVVQTDNTTATEAVDIDDDSIELTTDINELVTSIQEEPTQENARITDKIIGLFKSDDAVSEPAKVITDDTVDEALIANIESAATATVDATEVTDTEFAACVGDDSKIDSLEEWQAHLKAKIKTFLLEDEQSHCVDLLLEELYLSS